MTRATRALWALYTVLALGLLRCALVSYQAHSPGYTAFFAATSTGAALAIVHTSWLLDEHRRTLARLNHPSQRAHTTATKHDQTIADALAEACCEAWWATAGLDHDPTCPNHQHRSNA